MHQEKLFYEKTNQTFTDFYKKYHEKMVWYLMKMVNDVNFATEVADESMIESLEQIEKYNETKGHVSTWFFTNARHLMLAHLKSKQRLLTSYLFEGEEGNSVGDNLTYDDTCSEDYYINLTKKIDIVKSTIHSLDDIYRHPLMLCYIDGLSYKEIADYLNINLNTIKSRIRNGKILLKQVLEHDFKEFDTILNEY